MNKSELIELLKSDAGLIKTEAKAIVELFFDQLTDALARGERVEIRGLCSFYVKHYDAYTGRNPKKGAKVKISPKRLPFFKAGLELKRRVDRFEHKSQCFEILDRCRNWQAICRW